MIRNSSLSYVSFSFPYALSLSNGNILVIHKTGITICDNLLTKIIKNIKIFETSEQIKTEASLSKITTTKMNNYIISIINDKIHIFNDIGDLLFQNNTKILSSSETAEYYTVISYKMQYDYYYYLIGFVDNKLLNFLYYKYDSSTNKNYLISTSKGIKNKYNNYLYYIESKALSCQYMIDNYQDKAIVCFFLVYDYSYYLAVDYFSISNNNLVRSSDFHFYHFEFPKILCIKSSVTPDKSKALVSLYLQTGQPRYFIFNINTYYYDDYIQNFYFIGQHCRNQFHGLKVNHYEDSEEYILTCIDDNGKILIEMYDKNLNNYNYSFKYTDCEEIYGYSILFSIITKKYYIISDVNCNEKKFPINLLYGEMNFEEEEKKKEEKEEEEEEGKEEEEEEKEEVKEEENYEEEEKEKEEKKEEEKKEEKEEEENEKEEEKEKKEKKEEEKEEEEKDIEE